MYLRTSKFQNCIIFSFSYILFEYCVYRKRKFDLKNQKRVSCFINEKRFKEIQNDILTAINIEREDIQETMMLAVSSQNTDYDSMIDIIIKENSINFNQILHIPIALELIFSVVDCYFYSKLSYMYSIKSYEQNGNIIYYIRSNNNVDLHNRKKILIFSGLSESFIQIYKLINLILESGIDIIFPIYGPSKLSFGNKLNHNVYDYSKSIIRYLNLNEIDEFDILAWSLGGIKYLCFDEILKHDLSKTITNVYLFEPLLTTRSVMDVYLAHNRSLLKTFQILNKRTFKLSTKYKFFNCIMSYALYSYVVFAAANSSHFLYHTEKKTGSLDYCSNRYLFLSESDFLCNQIADKNVIETKFDKKNIYTRVGYHGGFLCSTKLNTIFIPLLIKNLNK